MKASASKPLFALLALVFMVASSHAASPRYVALISDLHVGAGREQPNGHWRSIEDFRWQRDFDQFLRSISEKGGGKTDLVLAGDVFEMWQSPFMKCSSDAAAPHCEVPDCHEADTEIGCTEGEAMARLKYILDQHQDFVAAIKSFAEMADNHVYFIPGNHDAALLFDGVGRTLLDQFPGGRVQLLSQGYWLSLDGKVYADHGHQFDDVNMFELWPRPFLDRDGVRYMRKPWGENMVQEFYNQYENVFPIIDNLSDEKTGVEYAIKQVGIGATAEAVGKFFRFFLFQQTFGQAIVALGEGDDDASYETPLAVKWDYAKVRKQSLEFFLDVLPRTDPLSDKLRQAAAQSAITFEPARLSDSEIDSICGFKQVMPDKDVARCPPIGAGRMGAAVKGLFVSRESMMAKYLAKVLSDVQRGGQSAASVYVSGHTHSATMPAPLTLTDLPAGAKTIMYVNTGAFQRLASPEQIDEILRSRPDKGASPLNLTPEDLPGCYTFVEVPPYAENPVPASMKWAKGASGAWRAEVGTCF